MGDLSSTTPAPIAGIELNQLGDIRIMWLSLMAVLLLATLYSIVWVFVRREAPIVTKLQPLFLATIGVGLLVSELAVVPLSIDDGIASQRGCDIACMSSMWLVSIGFTIVFAAIIAKLWRIDMVFNNASFRRITVEPKDVLAPIAVLFTLNFAILLTWTLVDPLSWERKPIDDNESHTYGACTDMGSIGEGLRATLGLVNLIALIVAIRQAWKTRHISSKFSESKRLGIVLVNWLQLQLIGIPMFLVGHGNPSVKYSLEASLILSKCASMLLAFFSPMILQYRASRKQGQRSSSSIINSNAIRRISGLDPSTLSVAASWTAGRQGERSSSIINNNTSRRLSGLELKAANIAASLDEQALSLSADVALKKRIAELEKKNLDLELQVMRIDEGESDDTWEDDIKRDQRSGAADDCGCDKGFATSEQ